MKWFENVTSQSCTKYIEHIYLNAVSIDEYSHYRCPCCVWSLVHMI